MTLCLYVLPFLRYSASKNSMTLKTRLGVIENGAIPYTTLYWFACFRHCNHSTFWYRFWVIWRWIILWPWNLGLRSLKIIQTDTIRRLGWGFLFAFHSNYGSILHNNRRKAIYWSKILIFILPCIPRPRYRLAVWLSGNTLASINVVALRQTRLVLGWVTVCGRVNHLGM